MLQSWAHGLFWGGSSGGGPGPSAEAPSLYPAVQSVVLGTLWGSVAAGWDRWRQIGGLVWRATGYSEAQLSCVTTLSEQISTYNSEQTAIVRHVSTLVMSPIYEPARAAVRRVATHPQMREHHYWTEVGRVAKAWGWSENTYRRLAANELAHDYTRHAGSTVSNQPRELAVELAYYGLTSQGK